MPREYRSSVLAVQLISALDVGYTLLKMVNNIKFFISKRQYLFINLLLLVVCLGVGLQFETNDDVGMKILTEGFYGEPSNYIIFSNVIWGTIIATSYRICGGISWYSVYSILVIFVSMCAISYVIETNITKELRVLVEYPIILTLGFELYCSIQFTKTAAIATTAGFLLLFDVLGHVNGQGGNVETKKNGLKRIVIALMLIVMGIMIRYRAFLVVFLFSIICAFDVVITQYKNKLIDILKISMCYVVIIILFLATNKIDSSYLNNHKEWKEYKEWYSAVSQVVDFDIPAYWETNYYEEHGIAVDDFYMVKGWYFGDPKFFTKEYLEVISDVKSVENKVNFGEFYEQFLEALPGIFQSKCLGLLLYICMLYSLFFRKRFTDWLVYFGCFMAMVCSVIYFVYRGKNVNRVYVTVWIAALLIFLLKSVKEKSEYTSVGGTRKNTIIVVCVLGIILLPNIVKKIDDVRKSDLKRAELQKITLEIANDKSNFYVNDPGYNMFEVAWGGVFDTLPKGVAFDNVADLAGWLVNTPQWNKNLENYGVLGLFEGTADRNVIYVANESRIPSIIKFINDHYDPEATMVKTRDIIGTTGEYVVTNHKDVIE